MRACIGDHPDFDPRARLAAVTTIARGLLRCFVLVLAAVVLFLTAATLARTTDFWSRGPDASDVGTATVRACTQHGPVSLYGFGTTYGCTAEVRWADGRTEVLDFPAGQLSPGGSDVPVFESRGGWRTATGYGVNDSSAWYAIGAVAALGLFLAALAAVVAAVLAAVATARGIRRAGRAEPGYDGRPAEATGVRVEPAGPENDGLPARQKPAKKSKWPVDAADRAAVPRGAVHRRMRLLIGWCLAAAALQLLSTIPRNDAPRALNFTSPWPQVERAWLVTPDDVGLAAADFGIPLLAVIAAVLLAAMRRAGMSAAARVVRYGEEFLSAAAPGAPKSVKRGLGEWESKRRGQLLRGRLYALVILALAAYALIHAIEEFPAGAPLLVVVGGLRDALLLGGLGVILLATLQSKYDRLMTLLRRHEELHPQRARAGMGP